MILLIELANPWITSSSYSHVQDFWNGLSHQMNQLKQCRSLHRACWFGYGAAEG